MGTLEAEVEALRRIADKAAEEALSLRQIVDDGVDALRAVMDRVDHGDARDAEMRQILDGLDSDIHKTYAGGVGIGPRVVIGEVRDEITIDRVERLERQRDTDAAAPRSSSTPDWAASGPSWWAILNPALWWEKASEDTAGRAIRVFAMLVALAVGVYLVVQAVEYVQEEQGIRRAMLEQQTRQANATQKIANEPAIVPLSPARDTVAIVPAP